MKKVFRVSPKYNAAATYNLKSGPTTFAAAPFDTPTHVDLSMKSDGMILAEFHYAYGDDEERVTERLPGGITAQFGTLSDRVMQLEVSKSGFAQAAESLRSRQRKVVESVAIGQPLRKVAHYGLVSSSLLPAMDDYIASALPDLRRITNH